MHAVPSRRDFLAVVAALAAPAVGAQQPAVPATTAPPPPLELVVLGSGGPGPTGRAGASYLLLIDGVPRILVDAGPGSFARLGEAKLSLAKTDTVLLTHLHIDHVGELPGLFKARAVSSRGEINFKVFGPDGRRGKGQGENASATFPSTTRLMDLLFGRQGAFGYLRDFSAPMTIQSADLRTAAAGASQPKKILSEGGLEISAIAGHHRDAPAVIYRVDYAGKSITFTGDIDADGLPGLSRIAKGTDVLVFNTVVLDPPGSPAVLYTLHTPPKTIGEIAGAAGTKTLVLSHLSPALDGASEAVQASIGKSYQGITVFARDGMRLVLP